MAQTVKVETWVRSLGWEDPLEKGMAAHSSILVWRIPWTEEPGGLQSMGSQRIGHNRVSFASPQQSSFLDFPLGLYCKQTSFPPTALQTNRAICGCGIFISHLLLTFIP